MNQIFYATKEKAWIIVTFLIIIQMFAPAKAQMRQVYLDTFDADNHINKISFYSPSQGYVAFSKWIGFTSDSGKTFTRKYITYGNVDYGNYSVNITFGFSIRGVKAFNHDSIIVYGDYGFVPAILYSTNGCNSFSLVFHSQNSPLELTGGITDMIFPQNNNIGYAIDADRILKTINKGRDWSVVRSDPHSYFNLLEAVDNSTVFAVSRNFSANKLLKTTNGGSTWQQVIIPPGIIGSPYFISVNKGWLTTLNGIEKNLYYTSNGGTTWSQKNDTKITPFGSLKMKFINDSTGYALQDYFTIFKTTDSGKVWEPLPRDNNYEYLGYSHFDLQIQNTNQLWAGGGHGFLELSTNGGGTPLPKAFFKIDTTGVGATDNVKLINYSRRIYQYKWYVNDILISTGYHASYTHSIFNSVDIIKLVVVDGSNSDTSIKAQYFAPVPPPDITSFTPNSATGGTTITISGSNFLTTNSVRFGGIPAVSFHIVSGSIITAEVGDGESGHVQITTSGGTDSLPGFTFIPPPPRITFFTPAMATPGTIVSITGNYFDNATAVSFGGVPASSFTVVSRTKINAVVGPGATGSVLVTTPTGTGGLAGFTLKPLTAITSFSPTSGPIGTIVTISGTNFGPSVGDNIVHFGGVKAIVISANPTTLVVTVPTGATYLPLSVTTDGKTACSDFPFHVTFAGGGSITAASFINAGRYQTQYNAVNNGCMGDIDGDGKLDVLTGNLSSASSISVFRNTSSGNNISFVRTDLFYNSFPIRVLLRDLNSDGKPDMITTLSIGIKVARNTSTPGNISFDTIQYIPGDGTAFGLAIGDIDGDNRPDIVKATRNDGILVFRNTSLNAAISFEPTLISAASVVSQDVAIADLDNDQKPELISADGNVSVFRNLSTPGIIRFAPRMSFPAFSSNSVATADLDGDGKTDLAVTHLPQDNADGVAILRNTSSGPGNISFASFVNCPAFDAYSVQIADLDGDGQPDLVSANQADQTVSIFKNASSAGNISFLPRVNFTTGLNVFPRSAPLGDLNGDGRTDFAYINYNQFSFTVFKNNIGESLANAGDDATICRGNSHQIGTVALAGNTYSWTSNPSGFSSTLANPMVTPTVTTTYYLAVTNASVLYLDTVKITVNSSPAANAGADRNICSGNSIEIGSPAVSGNTYGWTSIPVGFISTSANPVVAPGSSTTYFLSVTNTNGCTAKDTVLVQVNSLAPSIVISGTTTLNQGQSASLVSSISNGGTNPVYQWQDSVTSWQNILGATAQAINYTPLASGNKIRCILTSNAACAMPATVASAALTFTVNTVTGVSSIPASSYGIKLYPNPVNSTFTIDTLKLSDRWQSIEITGMEGKHRLFSQTISNQTKVSINVSTLPGGLYLAVIRKRSGEIVYLRFVKQ